MHTLLMTFLDNFIKVIPWDELPCMDTWLNCDVELCPLIVHQDGVIEDAGCSAIEVRKNSNSFRWFISMAALNSYKTILKI